MRRGRRGPGAAPTDSPTSSTNGPATQDQGAAALEFALVAPILFGLLFMIFGAGWGLWEYQAARASAREAARLASLGIPDPTAYQTAVVCLGERNGMQPGSLVQIDLTFHRVDASGTLTPLTSTTPASVGDYVQARLTYTSSIRDLPVARWTLTDDAGHFRAVALTRVEQVPVSSGVVTDQTVPVLNEVCP
jgi:hypothetical protein